MKRFRLPGWMSSLGPGSVYVLTILGSGDIVANATAGASYGYSLIWALAMTLVFRFIWVNASAKYVLVTGESLLTGYARLSKWILWIVLFWFISIRHFTNQFLILMIGSSAHLLFPLPTQWSSAIWAALFTLVGFAMIFWGGYPVVESFCKVLIGLMGGSLLIAALLSNPDPAALLKGTFLPSLPQAHGSYSALLIVMALIGAEAGSIGNLCYAYFIREKGWTDISHLKRQRFDLAVGVAAMFLMGVLVQVAAAAVIHPMGINVEDADDLVRIFSETQGWVGLMIFGLGLWGASFSTFVGSNTGFALIGTDICRTSIPWLKRPEYTASKEYVTKKDPIYRAFIIYWSLLPLYIIFTDVRPVWLVLMVSSAAVVLIPLLAFSLLIITNDKRLMGKYKNGWVTNSVLILLVVVAIYFTFMRTIELLG